MLLSGTLRGGNPLESAVKILRIIARFGNLGSFEEPFGFGGIVRLGFGQRFARHGALISWIIEAVVVVEILVGLTLWWSGERGVHLSLEKSDKLLRFLTRHHVVQPAKARIANMKH